MKKLFLTMTFIGSSLVTSAQVGVGTTAPKTAFQVNTSPVATVADGVLVPRVSVAELNAKANRYGTDQHGTLVFVTALAGAANETSTITATGFHFYNSTTDKWVAVGAPQVAVPYQNIKGGVSFTNASSYSVGANDFFVITTSAGGTAISFPNLTSADAGRVVYVYNGNPLAVANTFSNVSGSTTNPQVRGLTVVWSGQQWFSIS